MIDTAESKRQRRRIVLAWVTSIQGPFEMSVAAGDHWDGAYLALHIAGRTEHQTETIEFASKEAAEKWLDRHFPSVWVGDPDEEPF